MPTNIDDFDRAVALILGSLYASFPEPAMFNVKDLLEKSPQRPESQEEFSRLLRSLGNTVIFLRDEGYLRTHQHSMDRILFPMTVLTAKGLAALQRVPESLKEKRKSAGEFFHELGRETLKEGVKELVKTVVRGVLGEG